MSDLTVEQLSDGRLQIFEIDTNNNLWTRFKTTTSPDGPWSGWQQFASPASLRSITAGRLEDGRIQVFAVDVDNQDWSMWKVSTDPNAAWTEWSKFS
ncbi:hypothetical protein ACR9E3_14740 [Actinomycetospora sp. C-140]